MSLDPSLASTAYKLCPSCRGIYPASSDRCPRDGTQLVLDERILAGKFILVRKIGEGNMGAVYEAEQPQIGRTVAVKVLRPDPEIMLRFEREVKAGGSLNHTNVVTVYDSGVTEDGRGYIAMEYLEGESLARFLEKKGALPPALALQLWTQAVRAMAAAHAKGVVHRDLKPDNIFLARRSAEEGNELVVKVVDFGIAKFHQKPPQGKGTTPGFVIGTMQYMAPEQMQGAEAAPSIDVYALGLILVEMLTGKSAWGSNHQDVYAEYALRLVKPPLPLRQLRPEQEYSPQLQQLVDELLAQDPKGRPAHAGEVLPRLKQIPEAQASARGEGVAEPALQDSSSAGSRGAARVGHTGTELVSPARLRGKAGLPPTLRRRLPMIGAAVLTLLVAGGAYLVLHRPPSSVSASSQTKKTLVQTQKTQAKPAEPSATTEQPAGAQTPKTVVHRPQHEPPPLQVQFAFTDVKGVRLTCGSKRLPPPDCSGGGICKSTTTVSASQKCIAEKNNDKKVFTYKDLQKNPPDRKNLIHVLVRFP